MDSIRRLLFAVIGLTSVLLSTAYSADAPKQRRGSSGNASRSEGRPVHLVVRSSAEIKQTFTYSPHPAVPSELEGYGGSQVGGTGTSPGAALTAGTDYFLVATAGSADEALMWDFVPPVGGGANGQSFSNDGVTYDAEWTYYGAYLIQGTNP